jgi:hypothetical protein
MMENLWGVEGIWGGVMGSSLFLETFFWQNFTGLEGDRQDEKRIIKDLVWMNGFTQPYPRSEREIK